MSKLFSFLFLVCLTQEMSKCHLINNLTTDNTECLSQKAIYVYLNSPNRQGIGLVSGKGLIKLDPILMRRKTLTINGRIYFDSPMTHPDLLYPDTSLYYRLVIPDSLKMQYTYTALQNDNEHEYGIIYQFSPLLRTKQSDIYLMECHSWGNLCRTASCFRILTRGYLKYKIENDSVFFLGEFPIQGGIDFLALGLFCKKDMDNAKPGDKIQRFGCGDY